MVELATFQVLNSTYLDSWDIKAFHHYRNSIRLHSPREILWIDKNCLSSLGMKSNFPSVSCRGKGTVILWKENLLHLFAFWHSFQLSHLPVRLTNFKRFILPVQSACQTRDLNHFHQYPCTMLSKTTLILAINCHSVLRKHWIIHMSGKSFLILTSLQ